jgi:hypothetical protein
MASYAWVKSTGVLDSILGGKATLGAVAGTDYPALMPGLSGEIAGLVLGVVFIAVAFLLPDSLRPRQSAASSHKGHHAHP